MQSHPSVAGLARRGLSTSGPLATAVAAVVDAHGPRAPLGTRSDPAAFLAQLMDLHGSVALARELELLERRPAPARDPSVRAHVRALAEERVAELADVIDQIFARGYSAQGHFDLSIIPRPRQPVDRMYLSCEIDWCARSCEEFPADPSS